MLATFRLGVFAVALVVLPLPLTNEVAGAAPPVIAGCPGYASLLSAASDALRRGDRETALAKLQEARAMLTTCSGGTFSSGRQPEAEAPQSAQS